MAQNPPLQLSDGRVRLLGDRERKGLRGSAHLDQEREQGAALGSMVAILIFRSV